MSQKPMPYTKLRNHIAKWAGKKTGTEIAQETGRGVSTIYSHAADMGISLLLNENVERIKATQDAIREHGDKHTAAEIARMVKTSTASVHFHARKLGIQLKMSSACMTPRKEKETHKEGLFNAKAHNNWLV